MVAAGLTVAQIASRVADLSDGVLAAEIIGDASRVIDSVAALDAAGPTQLSFLANSRYRSQVAASRAGALALARADADALLAGQACSAVLLLSQAPYAFFAYAAQALDRRPASLPATLAPSAAIDVSAQVDASAHIEAHVVIAGGAVIGAGCRIGAGSFIGAGVRIGAGCQLHPNVTVLADCAIGERAIVHSGAVIGADGFGFAPLQGRWVKIPQSGRVLIGADVEIGANTTIDRGTMGDTIVEDGVKMDNQVQIAHNCRIGAHTVIAGCVGIAGSAVLGRGCQIGGAAMIHGHISIADGTVVSAGTLISRSLAEPGFYTGVFPFMRNREWERNAATLRHLDELRDRVRALEKQLRITHPRAADS